MRRWHLKENIALHWWQWQLTLGLLTVEADRHCHRYHCQHCRCPVPLVVWHHWWGVHWPHGISPTTMTTGPPQPPASKGMHFPWRCWTNRMIRGDSRWQYMSWVVLWYSDMCTWIICTRHVSTIICVKRELACMLPLRHNREYFVKYQNIFWRSQWMVLSMENISWEIFGDMCEYGHVSWDNIWRWVCWVQLYGHGSCKTHHIEKSKKHAYP